MKLVIFQILVQTKLEHHSSVSLEQDQTPRL